MIISKIVLRNRNKKCCSIVFFYERSLALPGLHVGFQWKWYLNPDRIELLSNERWFWHHNIPHLQSSQPENICNLQIICITLLLPQILFEKLEGPLSFNPIPLNILRFRAKTMPQKRENSIQHPLERIGLKGPVADLFKVIYGINDKNCNILCFMRSSYS